ncbi:MAG: hypothetical protein AAB554_05280 [Patescibacteria group bacterium]
MRAMLAMAISLAGCLHAQAPVKSAAKAEPETMRTFYVLINDADTIAAAADFAKSKGLRRQDWIASADRAYWRFMRATVYPPAAEIASRFGFGEDAVRLALEAQRGDVKKAVAAYVARKHADDESRWLYSAIWEFTLETRISCRYAAKDEALKTVESVRAFGTMSGEDDVLYPLLDEACPVDPQLRDAIIDAARLEDRDAYAIRHAAAADWDWIKTSEFIKDFVLYDDCAYGVQAIVAFKLEDELAGAFIENSNCESEIIDSSAWKLPPGTAGRYFFAAVRGRKYNLALVLLPFTGFVEDGLKFLFQEAMRGGFEGMLVPTLKMHEIHHEAFMAYAWERGRYRFIANSAQTIDWQRKAFDKLIELGKWEDAAEAAQYGVSETLRTEGVLIAFRAAMAAGDFKAGLYFLFRYGPVHDKTGIVTQEMYDAAKDAWYEARQASVPPPDPAPKPKRKRHRPERPKCADDDWCP